LLRSTSFSVWGSGNETTSVAVAQKPAKWRERERERDSISINYDYFFDNLFPINYYLRSTVNPASGSQLRQAICRIGSSPANIALWTLPRPLPGFGQELTGGVIDYYFSLTLTRVHPMIVGDESFGNLSVDSYAFACVQGGQLRIWAPCLLEKESHTTSMTDIVSGWSISP
jgi:hypothetical protein